MPDVQLNWESAEVKESTLSVGLDGELSDEWQKKFETTAKLLGGGQCDDVEIEEQAVRVHGLRSGGEEKLRHYLESVVSQANASLEAAESGEAEREADSDEDGPPDEQGGGDEQEAGDEEQRDDADTEMTERFRSFGSERGDDEESRSKADSGD